MHPYICARCGGPIDGGDEDMCSVCLSTMVNVAVDIPADFDPDPDACERQPPPEGVHFTTYPRLDEWIVNEFELVELRQMPDGQYLVIHHFSCWEDSFWRQKGPAYDDRERARTAALHIVGALCEEEAQAEREAWDE